jgi:hypothetical protein
MAEKQQPPECRVVYWDANFYQRFVQGNHGEKEMTASKKGQA